MVPCFTWTKYEEHHISPPVCFPHHYVYTDRYNDSTGDGRFHSSSRSKSFAVTVLVYASDGHQVPKLRDAKVGTICVAVALQSLKQASRAIWSAANGVATDIGDELASTRAVLGCRVIQILLGRIRKFRRRSRNVACLVLYWKFPGAIVAFPLDSGVFRLRNHVDVDKSEAGGMNCETKVKNLGGMGLFSSTASNSRSSIQSASF